MSKIIKTKSAFTVRDASTGALTSFAYNTVYTVADALGTSLIADGLAELHTYIDPSGSVNITTEGSHDVTQYETAVVSVTSGTLDITENGEVNVEAYKKANVAVPLPEGSTTLDANGTYDITQYETVVINVGTATVSYNVNGGTGEVDAQTAIKGNSINLSDGTGITAPEGKEFAGWATTAEAEEADAESPFKVTENVTLYAFYTAAAES